MKNAIALLGQPNSGKSTVYNALTGSRQHVGNWPGKTVEKNDGFYTYNGTRYTVTDLPGSYGLSGNSDEEIITADFIKSGQADLVCILVDASQLERSMYIVAEFAGLNRPAVLLLNMMDVAMAQKKEIDHQLLQSRLGIPVLPFTAAESKGYDELKGLLAGELKDQVRALVQLAPAAVLRDDALKGELMGRKYDPANPPRRLFVLFHYVGRSYFQVAQTLPIYEVSAGYQGPVCLIHGKNDRIVPFEYSEKYHGIYADGELHLLEGENHFLSKKRPEVIRTAVSFLKRHLR